MKKFKINMLHLQKTEIINDIKKLTKECSNHQDIVELFQEALETLNKHTDESIKEYLRNNYVIVQSFIYTFEKKKNCSELVVDYIYTFLANSILRKSSLNDIARILNLKTTWNEHEKMKILQMSFYLVRQDGFSPLGLFNYLCQLINDPNKQIANTARPITIQIIDYLFNKVETGDFKRSVDEGCTVLLGESEIIDIDVFMESTRLINPQSVNSVSETENDALNLVKDIYNRKNESKNLSLFYFDILILIGQKKNVFKCQSLLDFFNDCVFPDVNTKLIEGSAEEKEKIVIFVQSIFCNHSNLFQKEFELLLNTLEHLMVQKECSFVFPLILSIPHQIIEKHQSAILNILLNLLNHFQIYHLNSDYLNCICNLSEFFNKNDQEAFEKFSMKYLEMFKDTKSTVNQETLIGHIIEFSLRYKNFDIFETVVVLLKNKKMEKFLLDECVKNRRFMENTWEIIFDNIFREFEDIEIEVFNGKEAFYYVKALTAQPTRCPLDETVVFYSTTFEKLSELLKNQENIKIIDLFANSFVSLLNSNESKEDCLLILSKYCKMVFDYTALIETPTLELEKHLVELLRSVLSLNVTFYGPLVLQTLHSLLRIYIPTTWEDIFLIIEMCTVSHLHGDLFKVLDYIIEKYLDNIGPDQFLILFSCLEDIGSGSDETMSNKAILTFHEIGEVIISLRIVNGTDYSLWRSFITILYQFTGDTRNKIKDRSTRILLQFIFCDFAISNENESNYSANNFLIPLLESRLCLIEEITQDSKTQTSFIVLLEELSKGNIYFSIQYLEVLLKLINGILKEAKDSQVLIDLSLSLLTTKTYTCSIQVYQNDFLALHNQKKNKINFTNTVPKEEEINKLLFEFYQNIFLGFEEYPPYVYTVLLEGLKRFNRSLITSKIEIFNKILRSSNDVLIGKTISVLCSFEEEVVLKYLLNFVTDSLTLATLILSDCVQKLRTLENEEIVCQYLIKIEEVGFKYECLWEKSLFYLVEASKYVKTPKVYDSYVEVTKSLFNQQLIEINLKEDTVTNNFQIYSNNQFSHYLEHDPIDLETKSSVPIGMSFSKTIEFRKKERLLLNYLIVYYKTINRIIYHKNLDVPRITNGFDLLISLTSIKSSKPFTFYNLSFKCYHLLFESINFVYDDLQKVLKKVIKNYNEEAKVNNMLFSSIKQREIYLVFELLIEKKDKKLIESLKKEITNCLKNKDFKVVEYVRKNLNILYAE